MLLYDCISSFAEAKEYRLKIRRESDNHINSLGNLTFRPRIEILSSSKLFVRPIPTTYQIFRKFQR